MAGVSRRRLVLVGAGGLVTMGLAAVAVTMSEERGSPQRSRRDAAATVFANHLEDARVLGAAYLSTRPNDPVVASARRVPPGSVPSGTADQEEWFTGAAPARLAGQSASGCRDDFAGGRIVEVDGWLLPRTAVQLCAIVSGDA